MRTYHQAIGSPLWPSTALTSAALLMAMLTGGTAYGQADPRRADADGAFAERQVVRQANEATAVLYKRLPLEVEFVAAACGLNEEQIATLHDDGRRAIDRLTEEAAGTMRKYQRFNRIQIVVRANGAPAVVPWGGVAQPGNWSQLQIAQKPQGRQERPRAVPRRVARQGPIPEALWRRIKNSLEQRVEEIEGACALTQEQRVKLLLAGKLDVERLRAELSAPPTLAEGEELLAMSKMQVAGARAPRPYEAEFDDERSCFQKALKGRLSDEQKQELAAAEAQRRAFHRQALIAATVSGFERVAALTSRQWERLAAALTISIALDDLWPRLNTEQDNWRDDVIRLVHWPEEWWRPFFFDFQWWPARQHHEQLKNTIQQYKMQRGRDGAAPPRLPGAAVRIMGGGTF